MALKNVRYRLAAKVVPKPGFSQDYGKLNACFERRAKHGKCFQQPYFGCREFPAFFEYLPEPAATPASPVPLDQHLGWMLYDVFDLDKATVKANEKPFISLFEAKVIAGVLEVPPFRSNAVRKPLRA